MKVLELRRRIVLPARREDVFEFFSRPENLAALTPPSLGFQVLTPSPIRMAEGAVFDYVVRPFLFPIRWTSLITEFDPPHRFVDVQLRGPYSFWHHTHEFRDDPSGGTWMEDSVLYLLPMGFMGAAAAPLVRRQLERIFDHRSRVIGEKFR